MPSPRPALAFAAAALLGLTACGTGTEEAKGADGLTVVASAYPLQFLAERIGGDQVSVSNLTKAGGEPHDVELSPRSLVDLRQADLVIYQSDFQPAVDDAVADLDNAHDVVPAAHLELTAPDDGHDHGGDASTGSAKAAPDPHFWLDPTKYADVADDVAEQFAQADPAHAAGYRARAQELRGELDDLDREFTAGLAHCAQDELVTNHAAFGYLAAAYGLHQEAVTGLSPESEASPQDLADAIAHLREHGITTVYAETLLPTNVVDTIARDSGADVLVLDPVEGVTAESSGRDYLEIMRANLTTLERGQQCR